MTDFRQSAMKPIEPPSELLIGEEDDEVLDAKEPEGIRFAHKDIGKDGYPEVVKVGTSDIQIELCSTTQPITELYRMLNEILSFPILKPTPKKTKPEQSKTNKPNSYLG